MLPCSMSFSSVSGGARDRTAGRHADLAGRRVTDMRPRMHGLAANVADVLTENLYPAMFLFSEDDAAI